MVAVEGGSESKPDCLLSISWSARPAPDDRWTLNDRPLDEALAAKLSTQRIAITSPTLPSYRSKER